jgi:chemotaxis protein CheD
MVDFQPIGVNARVIGIGEYCVGTGPMTTIGLGSCIALILHNERCSLGGMAHVMLPESKGHNDRPGKFADSAVAVLLEEMEAQGSRRGSVTAKLVGGANMFGFNDNNLNIGDRNIKAVHMVLQEYHIPVIAEDIGGKVGRSVLYFPQNHGTITVRKANGTCIEM